MELILLTFLSFLFLQTELNPSTSEQDVTVSKSVPRPVPTLAGACDLADIKTLLREWVTTITGACFRTNEV